MEEGIFGQYTEYDKIESHMELSRTMFLIDKKGKHILSQFDLKKFERKKRTGANVFSEDVNKIYTTLVTILNVNKFSPRLYISLQHYMEELLFREVSNHTKFYIEDDEFELTRLYFDQSSWIRDQDIQPFQLDTSPVLDSSESMCLVCFLKEYEDFLFTIEEYIRDINENKIVNELLKTIRRIKIKLRVIWNVVVEIISETIKLKN